MKKTFIGIVIFANLYGASLFADMKIIAGGKAWADIIIDIQADSMSQKAAKTLQDYLYKISGVRLEIRTAPARKMAHIFIGKKYLESGKADELREEKQDDAFIIYSHKKDLYLAGKNPLGDIYAVCALLEDYLECMKFTVEEEYVPAMAVVSLPRIDRIYSPAFSFRAPHFQGRDDRNFREWHRISSFDDWGMFVHTFQHLLPPEKYFGEHPEYYSLVGGRRVQDGQLCLSNKDVIELLKENLRIEIAKHPDKKYWSVSQNDCINYCECENCQKLYEKYGAYSGAYIQMANEIARFFPDKQISTLAYQFTRKAPTNIVPLENVNIMLCSIECNRSMPLAEDPRSADFVRDVKDWGKLTDNIFLWDYVVQFQNYLTPFPNFHVLQPNIQFFRDNHAAMMFQQGSGDSWSDMSDLKHYLIAKLLWDPDLNVDSLITRFMDKYYGDAAPYIRQYYDLIHRALIAKQGAQQLDIYGFPVFYYNSFLTPQLLVQYQQLMDSAESAVKDDSAFYTRVLRARIPADFAYLDIALNTNNDLIKWTVEKDGETAIDPGMTVKLDRFVRLCEQTGIENINEKNLRPADYREFVLRNLSWMTEKNKLDNAEVKLLTQDSPKYPVGGVRALNDRLFGGLDFHFNWLGFENEDMAVSIDLGGETEFSRVRMNFLKEVGSWVFLPENVIVEVSADGKVFREIAGIKGDNSDRSYLVKSVPFELTFDKTVARYVRITAISMKTCPEWHRGFGKPSWIFVDEIILQ